MIEKAFSEKNDAFRLLDEVESRVFKLYEKGMKKSYVDIKSAIHKTMEELESYHGLGGKLTGVPTGFSQFDELTGGFQKSDLIVLAGRPGQGKTALALNIVRNAAVDFDVPVAFFSLEMSTMQLVQRLISSEARVNLQSMRNGSLKDNQWQLMSMKVGKLAAAKLYIDDTAAISALELRAKARRLKRDKDIGLLVVDYLQLMRGPKDVDSREREISMISGGLKALAKELDIPVLALSQLNRQVEGRADKKPQLADLRESGAIEQDADLVCFIHRPETYKILEYPDDKTPTANTAEITIAKARNGPTGDFRLYFEKEYTKFERLTRRSEYTSPPEINAPVGDEAPF
jgi:replicative DNA helicase